MVKGKGRTKVKGNNRKGISACCVLTSSNPSYNQEFVKALSGAGSVNGEDAHYPLPYR